MLTLKSQEQKTFTAIFPADLRARNLLPKDVDMLQENSGAIKCTLQKGLENGNENNSLIVQPVHEDDADDEESDGYGKEIGCRYAVRHCLRLVAVQVSGFTCFDDGVGVVAVKHQAPRKVTLPEITDMWLKRELIMSFPLLVQHRTILPCL